MNIQLGEFKGIQCCFKYHAMPHQMKFNMSLKNAQESRQSLGHCRASGWRPVHRRTKGCSGPHVFLGLSKCWIFPIQSPNCPMKNEAYCYTIPLFPFGDSFHPSIMLPCLSSRPSASSPNDPDGCDLYLAVNIGQGATPEKNILTWSFIFK